VKQVTRRVIGKRLVIKQRKEEKRLRAGRKGNERRVAQRTILGEKKGSPTPGIEEEWRGCGNCFCHRQRKTNPVCPPTKKRKKKVFGVFPYKGKGTAFGGTE